VKPNSPFSVTTESAKQQLLMHACNYACMQAIGKVEITENVQHLNTDAENRDMGMTAMDDSPSLLIARLSGRGRGRGPLKVTAVQMIRIAASVRPRAACNQSQFCMLHCSHHMQGRCRHAQCLQHACM
jgi:hypothetical protein